MEFICAVLRRVHDDSVASLSTIVTETYSVTLMQYHGFVASTAFSVRIRSNSN
jgi:hypothetical protein